jgi:hypothetical protein
MRTFTEILPLSSAESIDDEIKLISPEDLGFDSRESMELVFEFALRNLASTELNLLNDLYHYLYMYSSGNSLNITFTTETENYIYIDSLNEFTFDLIKNLEFKKLIILLRKDSFTTEFFNLNYNVLIESSKLLNFIKITLSSWE